MSLCSLRAMPVLGVLRSRRSWQRRRSRDTRFGRRVGTSRQLTAVSSKTPGSRRRLSAEDVQCRRRRRTPRRHTAPSCTSASWLHCGISSSSSSSSSLSLSSSSSVCLDPSAEEFSPNSLKINRWPKIRWKKMRIAENPFKSPLAARM